MFKDECILNLLHASHFISKFCTLLELQRYSTAKNNAVSVEMCSN